MAFNSAQISRTCASDGSPNSISVLIDDSVVLVDKPPGLTSHEVTTLVKKLVGAKRAGHAGTLDPDVSGVLPVALGRATKLLQFISAKDKIYVGLIKFKKLMTKEEISSLFARFEGTITQTPPLISAVKKVPRKRKIHYLRIIEYSQNNRFVLFETKVDAGTYIRTLCEDMGKLCGGARMEELRRTAVGNILETQTHSIQSISDAVWLNSSLGHSDLLNSFLISPALLINFPKIVVKSSSLKSIISGCPIMIPALERIFGSPERGALVSVYCGSEFLGVGELMVSESDLIKGKTKGLAVKMIRIHKILP
ncbi:RNA-guided pseudouridylation complex pseudouridine synthase subunit Cbf5 [Candidatus Micrarchaeota archaeon]|nr:RNA-guided pseudouridylation complex pseudouridine synthase subunit Cbf5 [Candidatus Micrarchaeota archaeon]